MKELNKILRKYYKKIKRTKDTNKKIEYSIIFTELKKAQIKINDFFEVKNKTSGKKQDN